MNQRLGFVAAAERLLAVVAFALLTTAPQTLAAGETWSLAYPPPGLWKHSMIYDPPRHRVIVTGGFKGQNYDGPSAETWALSLREPTGWTPLPSKPVDNSGETGIYDPVRDRMVVWMDGIGVYTLPLASPTAWSLLATAGTPPPGGGHSVYDPSGDRMLVVLPGGNVYALSLGTPTSTWSHLATTGSGTGGYSASLIYDPVRNRLISCAGGTQNVGVGVWELSLTTLAWHQLSLTGIQPQPRIFASAIYDPNGDRMILFGGQATSYGSLHDTWALSLSGTPAWKPLGSAIAPAARWLHAAVYDSDDSQMIVFGGVESYRLSIDISVGNDAWLLPLNGPSEWAPGPQGPVPDPRWGHTAVYDGVRNRMVVFGGYDTQNVRDDASVLWLDAPRHWEALAPRGARPSARYLHSAIWDGPGQRMILFG